MRLKRRGFTLMELMVVMAIVVIVSGAGVAYGGQYLARRQVEGAAFQLVQDLREVQSIAMFTRRYLEVSFFPSGNYYTFERAPGGSPVRRDLNNAVGFAGYISGSVVSGASVHLTSGIQSPPLARVDLFFTPQGSASTSGTSVTPLDASEGRISLSNRGGVVIDVFVSPVIGQVRMAWR